MRSVHGLLASLTLLLLPEVASAQVWVGAEHELEVGLGTAFQFSDRAFEGPNTIAGVGAQSWQNSLTVNFVPIERLSIGIGGTWQLDRYSGAQCAGSLYNPMTESCPPPGLDIRHGANDYGTWEGDFSDFTASAAYVAIDGDITVTPEIHTKLPMGTYVSTGWAATGTGLREIGAGVGVGKVGAFTDALVIWGSAAYTFVEKEDRGGEATLQYRPSYSTANLSAAYALGDTGRLVLGGGLDIFYTFDGFDLEDWGPRRLQYGDDDGLVLYHDPVAKRRYLAISAFGLYDLSETLQAALMFSIIPVGNNVSDAKTIGLQLSWLVHPGGG